jgi:Fic family protein
MTIDEHVRKACIPAEPEPFLRFVRELHGMLYASVAVDFGGRFRWSHEPLGFGSKAEGKALRGAPAERIEGELVRLFCSLRATWPDRDIAAYNAAKFLHGFLVIHPFRDGNGRIARILTACLVRARSPFVLRRFSADRRSRHKYLGALKYADRRTDPDDPPLPGTRDAYRFLARWLGRSLVSVDPLEEGPG